MEQPRAGDCPVLQAWIQLEALVEIAARGTVVQVSGKKLTRQTCVDNRETLIPLILAVGTLVEIGRRAGLSFVHARVA